MARLPWAVMLAVLAAAGGLLGTPGACGATYAWIGASQSTWGTPGNWSNGHSPGPPGACGTAAFGATFDIRMDAGYCVNGLQIGAVSGDISNQNDDSGNTLYLGPGGITATAPNVDATYTTFIDTNLTLAGSQAQTWNIPISAVGGPQTAQLLIANPVNLNGSPLTLTGGGWVQYESGITGDSTTPVVISGGTLCVGTTQAGSGTSGGQTDATKVSVGNVPLVINNGMWQSSYGSNFGASGITVNAGGIFWANSLDGTSRIAAGTPVVLDGGNYRPLCNESNGASCTQTVGPTTVGGGETTYLVNANANNLADGTWTTAASSTSFTRSTVQGANNSNGTCGVVLFAGEMTADSHNSNALAQFYLGTAPALQGAGTIAADGTGATNLGIIPWAIGTNCDAQNAILPFGAGFVTYNPGTGPGTGVCLLQAANYDGALSAAGSGDNVRLTGNQANLSGARCNSLLIDISGQTAPTALALGGSGAGNGALVISSGALAFVGTTIPTGAFQTNQAVIGGTGSNVLDGIVFGSAATPVEAVIGVTAVHQNGTAPWGPWGNQQYDKFAPGALTINAPITASQLTKYGPGTLILTTTQNYSGVTTVDNGTIQLSGAGQLPGATILNLYGASDGISPNGYVTTTLASSPLAAQAQNGTLDLNGTNQTVAGLNGFTGAGGGAQGIVTNHSATPSILTVGGSGIAGALQGNVGLVMNGPGTLILGGGNNFTGGATVTGGILQIGYGAGGLDSAFAAASGPFNLNLSGLGLIFAPAASSTIGNPINGSGGIAVTGPGVVNFTQSGPNGYSGGTTLSGGTLSITATGQLGGGALTFNGGVLRVPAGITSINGNNPNWSSFDGGFDVAGAGDFVLSQPISGAGNLIKNGPGTLVLATCNTLAGTASINAGTLQLGNTNAMQCATVAVHTAGGLAFNASGTYNLGALAGAGGIALGAADGGPVTLNVGANNQNTAYLGTISGAGSLSKNGAGALTLSGLNTYTGGTSANGGTLVFDTSTALPPGTGLYVAAGAMVFLGDPPAGFAGGEGCIGGGAGPLPASAPSCSNKAVPEPGALALLLAAAACGFAGWRKKRGTRGCS